MLLSVAQDKWLLQDGAGSTGFATDPILLGRNDRATMTMLIRSITGGVTQGNVVLSMAPETSNEPSSGWNDAFTALTGESQTSTPYYLVSLVEAVYVRFRFTLTVANETGLKRVLFDAQVLLDKAS